MIKSHKIRLKLLTLFVVDILLFAKIDERSGL